jgi:hypothetical protein
MSRGQPNDKPNYRRTIVRELIVCKPSVTPGWMRELWGQEISGGSRSCGASRRRSLPWMRGSDRTCQPAGARSGESHRRRPGADRSRPGSGDHRTIRRPEKERRPPSQVKAKAACDRQGLTRMGASAPVSFALCNRSHLIKTRNDLATFPAEYFALLTPGLQIESGHRCFGKT